MLLLLHAIIPRCLRKVMCRPCICSLVSDTPDYSKVTTLPPCERGRRHCVTLSIEDELGVTITQRVNITLNSTDERIALRQTSANLEIKRIPSMCSYCFRDFIALI